MASLLLVKPLSPASVAVTLPGGGAQSGAANLLTPDPKEIWTGTPAVTGQASFDFDMGSAVPIDSFFLGFLAASGTAPSLFGVQASNVNYAGAYIPPGAAINVPYALSDYAAPRRQHIFQRYPAPVTFQYHRVWVNMTGGVTYKLGIAGLGLAIQPAYGREWGSGRQVVDMSSVTPLRGGGFGIDRGARKAAWLFTCGDLTDAEVPPLWDMAEDLGESSPVIACEDPAITAGLNERLHYGLFANPEAYSREAVGVTKWSFRIVNWV